MSVIVGNLIAVLLVVLLVVVCAREIWKSHKAGGCSGGCAGCSGSCAGCSKCARSVPPQTGRP
jgi:hypothetical protein